MRIISDNQSRVRLGDLPQRAEHPLDIVKISNSVRKHDIVEGTAETGDKIVVFGVTDEKRQIGMIASGRLQHLCTEINANPEIWLQSGKKVAGPAANLENTRAGGHDELRIASVIIVIGTIARYPTVTVIRKRFEMGVDGVFTGGQWRLPN